MYQEIKGNLAKLLATENLLVQHKAVKTASFDVHTRTLTLPIWKGLSNTVYDLLVGHEVGHALFTPDQDMTRLGAPKDYVNVTEDARVEKLMKRKFLGLRKDFWNGYRELNDKDFFGISGEEVNDMSLADRVNLHFKIGHFVDIEFNAEEQDLLTQIESAETFEDAIEAAKRMYDMHKQQTESLPQPPQDAPQGDSTQSSGQSSPGNSSETEEGQGEPDEETDDAADCQTNGGGPADDRVNTADALSESLQQRASVSKYDENQLIDIPEFGVDEVVVSISDFLENCRIHYACLQDMVIEEADLAYAKYRKSAAREVNYLVKEFECKKSASAYARSSTARTGVLDTAKLHTYKYNEDLFKKINIIPDGKNHGLIAVVDWSGSIGQTCFAMVKQLLNIAWFCKKAQIPFNAYLFTTEFPKHNRPKRIKPFQFAFGDTFSLVNVITTDLPARQFEEQLKYLFRLGAYFSGYGGNSPFPYAYSLNAPLGLGLGGTPLNDAIVSMHAVIPWFRKKYGVEKLNLIILTDGEANAGAYTTEYHSYRDPEQYSCRGLENRATLRNRKLGIVYRPFDSSYIGNTKIFIENLKNTFPETNVVSFRLIETRDVASWCRQAAYHCNIDNVDAFRKKIQKDRTAIVPPGLGYDAFYLITTKSMSLDTDFEVSEDATKAQIKSAFKKSLGNKAVNKKILSSFVSMVA